MYSHTYIETESCIYLHIYIYIYIQPSVQEGFPGGSAVKNLPAMQEIQETRIQPLSQEDSLERAWQPTPVFLPGKFHRQRSLVGYGPWGHKKSDTTDVTKHIHMHIKIIIISNCSHDYGGWEAPWSAICKLKTQKSWWCSSVWIQRPETKGLKVLVQAQEKTDVSAQRVGGEWILPPAIFLFYSRLSIDWMKPTYIGEGNLFTQSIASNPIQKHLYRYNQKKMFSQNIWTPCDPLKLIRKINHHRQAAIERNNQEKASEILGTWKCRNPRKRLGSRNHILCSLHRI